MDVPDSEPPGAASTQRGDLFQPMFVQILDAKSSRVAARGRLHRR